MAALGVGVGGSALAQASASPPVTFSEAGTGPGQVMDPEGISVDTSTGRTYVADGGNNRIDAFNSLGEFDFAFGWGVADGESAEPQVCSAICFAGLEGGGAGEFSELSGVAVDPASHRIYAYDGHRVQEFEPNGEFIRAWGGGVVAGAASGSAVLAVGSKTITSVNTTRGRFEPGATLVSAALPPGTKIVALGAGTMTLSQAATGSGARAISVAEGSGNVPVNELQELTTNGSSSLYRLVFELRNPSPSEAFTPENIPENASAATIQSALEGLPNIGAGNVKVTGPAGGPYEIEFGGTRFSDTDVPQLRTAGSPGTAVQTLQNGHSGASQCTALNAKDCAGGVEGFAEGQFARAAQIAIGPAGEVDLADSRPLGPETQNEFSSRVQEFGASGNDLREFPITGFSTLVSAFAINSSGDLYVASNGEDGAVRRYASTGACLNCDEPLIPSFNLTALALDSSDGLFVATFEEKAGRLIAEFDTSETETHAFGYGQLGEQVRALAAHEGGLGDIYVSEGTGSASRLRALSLPPPGPIVVPISAITDAAPRSARATLHGYVNPEGLATAYHFEYVDEATYQEDVETLGAGHGFDHATRDPANEGEDPVLAAGFNAKPVALEAAPLVPETKYRFRLVASNGEGTDEFEGKPFETLAPLELLRTWATRIESRSGRLHVTLNPLGTAASGYFEYVDERTYQEDLETLGAGHRFDHASKAPTVPIQFGAGEEPKTESISLTSLQPGTTYLYRFRATDPFTTVTSSPRAFSTLPGGEEAEALCPNVATRLGASKRLPDCRAYEMVSPVAKSGGEVVAVPNTPGDPTAFDRSAVSGDRLTYAATGAFAEPQGAPWVNQYMADRTSSGWQTRSISPPRGPSFYGGIFDNEFVAFSSDLCTGWLRHDSEPVLAAGAPSGYPGLYKADTCAAPESYEALSEVVPDVSPMEFQPEIQGISADGEFSIVRARAKLTPNATAGKFQVYESHGSKLRLICILPNGSSSAQDCSAGTANEATGFSRTQSVAHAFSSDGSRVYWTTTSGPAKLYLRENPLGAGAECSKSSAPCTLPVSEAAETLSKTSGAYFWAAAVDGSSALFTTGEDLYRFEPETKTTTLIAHEVKGVLGASDDLSRAYLVSDEAKALEQGEGAVQGKPNLYLETAGQGLRFVATLSAEDLSLNLKDVAVTTSPLKRRAAVSPDGLHLAFASYASLTGFDNTDANSGKPDLEVFVYDASAPNLGDRLHCVSCDPHGGSPEGEEVPGVNNAVAWVAATLPGWQNQFYQPRYLSEGGTRLFFETNQSLVSRDLNGKQDVYEWQAADGAQECLENASGPYSSSAGGCVDLISSGASSTDAELLDASPSGADVFFSTRESLVPQDPGGIDIYDARIGGGFPAEPPPLPECSGEGCQGLGSAVPSDVAPASSLFQGAGNLAQPKKKHRRHHKHKRRKHRHAHRGRKVVR